MGLYLEKNPRMAALHASVLALSAQGKKRPWARNGQVPPMSQDLGPDCSPDRGPPAGLFSHWEYLERPRGSGLAGLSPEKLVSVEEQAGPEQGAKGMGFQSFMKRVKRDG